MFVFAAIAGAVLVLASLFVVFVRVVRWAGQSGMVSPGARARQKQVGGDGSSNIQVGGSFNSPATYDGPIRDADGDLPDGRAALRQAAMPDGGGALGRAAGPPGRPSRRVACESVRLRVAESAGH